jgi:hypothetical protein
MKKTTRTNRMNLVVNWPKSTFTIKELNDKNPDFINITLRVRIKNAMDNGMIQTVGYLHNGKGRPSVLLACNPITQDHVNEARDRDALTADGLSLKVAEVHQRHIESLTVDLPTHAPETMKTAPFGVDVMSR